jgi:hypothetical protein
VAKKSLADVEKEGYVESFHVYALREQLMSPQLRFSQKERAPDYYGYGYEYCGFLKTAKLAMWNDVADDLMYMRFVHDDDHGCLTPYARSRSQNITSALEEGWVMFHRYDLP